MVGRWIFFLLRFFPKLISMFRRKVSAARIFPTTLCVAGIRTHVSRVASSTRDLNSGRSTDWATAIAAEAILFKLHSLKRPEVTKSLYPKLAFKVLVLFEVFKALNHRTWDRQIIRADVLDEKGSSGFLSRWFWVNCSSTIDSKSNYRQPIQTNCFWMNSNQG